MISSGRMDVSEMREIRRFMNIFRESIDFYSVPIGHSSDEQKLKNLINDFTDLETRLLESASENCQ